MFSPRRSSFQISQKFRTWCHASDQETITCPGAGNIEEVPFRGVDLFEFDLVSDGLDPSLKRANVVVAGHHDDRLELQSLGEMHRPDRDAPGRIVATLG